MLKKMCLVKETKKYLTNCFKMGKWLENSFQKFKVAARLIQHLENLYIWLKRSEIPHPEASTLWSSLWQQKMLKADS